MTFAPDPRKVPAAEAVVAEFKAEAGLRSGGLHPLHLRRGAGVRGGSRKAKSVELDKLSKALHWPGRDGGSARLTSDKKGDVTDPKYVFYIWKNGTYAEIQCNSPAFIYLTKHIPSKCSFRFVSNIIASPPASCRRPAVPHRLSLRPMACTSRCAAPARRPGSGRCRRRARRPGCRSRPRCAGP